MEFFCDHNGSMCSLKMIFEFLNLLIKKKKKSRIPNAFIVKGRCWFNRFFTISRVCSSLSFISFFSSDSSCFFSTTASLTFSSDVILSFDSLISSLHEMSCPAAWTPLSVLADLVHPILNNNGRIWINSNEILKKNWKKKRENSLLYLDLQNFLVRWSLHWRVPFRSHLQ